MEDTSKVIRLSKIIIGVAIVCALLSCIIAISNDEYDLATAWACAGIWASLYYTKSFNEKS
jgi:hypothetical protein